ncbi:TetR/AcrR family transcriptional repressor of nem operon [Paenibacillus rhizosphaerae]|uniref:TetR/AcrR family transcriptional repressor of nem operon n=1 Tax=Paenibacillus rhizosphaerae TaxID=297318 RepID=A0A839TPJ2_9BACL|nr:TetR/AcrR family transcriptional regulator [Paenibacillus rhizosphaerae]MBB3128685.1 TetR/AcrR family transcriptional repressor of nem operon [Paenibacillus rhizosphaerae]
MARPREFDEKKALNDALELFWEKGYEATTIADLAKKIGINRPSLYSAYGDKRGLFVLALNTYQQRFLDKLQDLLKKNGSGIRGIEAVFTRFIESTKNPTAQRGCFFVNSIAELAAHDEYIAARGHEFQEKISSLFEEALKNGRSTGDIPLHLDLPSVSHFLTMALVGLNIVIKTAPDENFVRNNVRIILNAVR